MNDFLVVIRGTLEVVETFGGFCLYGHVDNCEHDVHIACLGDGLDSVFVNQDTMTVNKDYDPNDDDEIALAYGFTFDDD